MVKIKAYDLALFILILTATVGMVDNLEIFPTHLAIEDESAKIEKLTGFSPSGDITPYEEQYSPGAMLISGIQLVVGGLLSTVWIAPTLSVKLGMPSILAGVMQVGIWVIYFLGGIQLVLNRSIKQYE